MVLVASQPIKRGQEVTDNYGMDFLNVNRTLRRKWLQVYVDIRLFEILAVTKKRGQSSNRIKLPKKVLVSSFENIKYNPTKVEIIKYG